MKRLLLLLCPKIANRWIRDVAALLFIVIMLHIPATTFGEKHHRRSSDVGSIVVDEQHKVLRIANAGLRLHVNYNRCCLIDSLWIGTTLLSDAKPGGFSGCRIGTTWYTTRQLVSAPVVSVAAESVTIRNILYAAGQDTIQETWGMKLQRQDILWTIERILTRDVVLEENAFPLLQVGQTETFDGALLGNGGAAWFRLFNDSAIAYGVHTDEATFWSRHNDQTLHLNLGKEAGSPALALTRVGSSLQCVLSTSPTPLVPRYDAGTHRRRFIRGGTDVWGPALSPAGTYRQILHLSAPDKREKLGRGEFKGLSGDAITEILNTIARLGVIDSRLYGGNSWHTPYGPICLHEQYIALQGLGINDENYTEGYKECLDYYRDHAIQSDGRVKSRWAYTNEDAMPGTADSLGFYEAQWGILMDSQPDLVINVAELFDLCGDRRWLASHKQSCEKVLDYILRRDVDHDSLVEMQVESHTQARGSDWLDVMWASWENALVNAEVYQALKLWSDLEELLGDSTHARSYRRFAAGLKESYNKPTTEGGFWDEENHWYVHWREPNGAVFGNNLVTPVNFMAIGYGICDDTERMLTVLHTIEMEMQEENLFFWPVCFFPYESGAGHELNYPFPRYENGDLFLSWGELGVRAYADLFPEVAIRYCKNIIRRYEKDGLAYQRYLRSSQQGSGDDILAGNASAVVGLYRNLYGIQPRYNRLVLRPRLVKELYGTRLQYSHLGKAYDVTLLRDETLVTADGMSVRARGDFGIQRDSTRMAWFNGTDALPSLVVRAPSQCSVSVSIREWNERRSWTESRLPGGRTVSYAIEGLQPHTDYVVTRDGYFLEMLRTASTGSVEFTSPGGDVAGHLFEVRSTCMPGHLRGMPLVSLARPVITPGDTFAFAPGAITVRMDEETPGAVIRYTTDGSDPTDQSEVYRMPITLTSSAIVKARAFRTGAGESATAATLIKVLPQGYSGVVQCGSKAYAFHKGLHKSVTLRHAYDSKYGASGNDALTDGVLGSANHAVGWQGFEKEDLEATIDLGRTISIDSIHAGFLQDQGSWIFFPLEVRFLRSNDGKHFESCGPVAGTDISHEGGPARREYRYSRGSITARYIRVYAKNTSVCPPDHPGAGGKAWLFVDEIAIY